jgi:four helix bundle protein
VTDNIAEGFGRGSRLEFVQFLSIARGSADEVKSQLYRMFDCNLISEEVFKSNYNQADILGAKIFSFMEYLNKTEHKGVKFRDSK